MCLMPETRDYNRYLRSILGVTRSQQMTERTTSLQFKAKFGMEGTIKEVMLKRLGWLGYTSRMAKSRMPKRILFGQLPAKRPFHSV